MPLPIKRSKRGLKVEYEWYENLEIRLCILQNSSKMHNNSFILGKGLFPFRFRKDEYLKPNSNHLRAKDLSFYNTHNDRCARRNVIALQAVCFKTAETTSRVNHISRTMSWISFIIMVLATGCGDMLTWNIPRGEWIADNLPVILGKLFGFFYEIEENDISQ